MTWMGIDSITIFPNSQQGQPQIILLPKLPAVHFFLWIFIPPDIAATATTTLIHRGT